MPWAKHFQMHDISLGQLLTLNDCFHSLVPISSKVQVFRLNYIPRSMELIAQGADNLTLCESLVAVPVGATTGTEGNKLLRKPVIANAGCPAAFGQRKRKLAQKNSNKIGQT